MSNEQSPKDWKQISSELSSYREEQRRLWGEVDPSTLGCYLANEANDNEREEVEQALEEHPELRRLTDLVREVLGECDPIDEAPTTTRDITPASDSTILSFAQARITKPYARVQRLGALFAAACLLLALGLGLFQSIQPGERNPSTPSVAQAKDSADVASRSRLTPEGLESRLTELDNQIALLDQRGQEKEALELTLEYPKVAKESKAENHVRYAESLAKAGKLYEKHHYYMQAEPTYRKAWSICQNELGPDADATVQQLNNLANVYQVALNRTSNKTSTFKFKPKSDMPGLGQARSFPNDLPPFPAPPMGNKPEALPRIASDQKFAEAREKDLESLRAQLVQQRPGDLRRTVVPVLSDAVVRAKSTRERVAYIRALSKLGPTAEDSAPVLVRRLKLTDNKIERQAILTALGQFGPTAPDVIPTLRLHLNSKSEQEQQVAALGLVRCGPVGRKTLSLALNQRGQQKAKLKSYLRDEKKRLGTASTLLDSAQLFSPESVENAEQQIADLSRNAKIDVFVETVSTLAESDLSDVQSRSQFTDLSSNGVYFLFDGSTKSVQLRVYPALREAGFDRSTEQRLQKELGTLTTNGDFDKALGLAIETLTTSVEKKPAQP